MIGELIIEIQALMTERFAAAIGVVVAAVAPLSSAFF